jgi:NADH dehydrogenase
LRNIVVIGAGFAGLWSSISAARSLDDLHEDDVRITVVNRDKWHGVRVRYYESDLTDTRIPLDDLLDPIGVGLVVGEVENIDHAGHLVSVRALGGVSILPYDRLILASGSQLRRPNLQGFDRCTFNVDTYDEAVRLEAHLHDLGTRSSSIARDHVVVVGAGLTGIEVACEMPERLKKNGLPHGKVTLIDALPNIGSHMGDDARPVIEEALSELGICTRTSVSVKSFDHNGVLLVDGERIETHTIIWAGGLQASNLAKDIPANTDKLGRLSVDKYLRVSGTADIFAAGDIAAAPVEDGYVSVMSCQHSRPMGRFAGHNAVAELVGHDMIPLEVNSYGTCLDLGPWGAVRTEGWERKVVNKGSDAKAIKTHINRDRIYPPRSQDRAEILESGRP